MTSGIILLAHGKKGYGLAAFNLAMSIKHHGCKLPIYLFAGKGTLDGVPLQFFDTVDYIDESFYMDGPTLNVAKSKIELINRLPYDHNLYLDVDGMALKDLTPLIEGLSNQEQEYLTDVMGTGQYGEDIVYDMWAKHDFAWWFFGLDQDDTWRTIQSSWAYFRKGSFTQSLYGMLRYYLEKKYPLNQLKHVWAKGQLPDELLFSGVCAKLGYDPGYNERPVFFGNVVKQSTDDVIKEHYVLSMYGNGNTSNTLTRPMWQEYYSGEVHKMSRLYNVPWYKSVYVMRDKILNR